ncbi:MAG: cation diffusion facilitator family transporter [Actinomycetota bacterium]|nr:cation diffusion facilitator family transporter [Actinomycetota bacterium]
MSFLAKPTEVPRRHDHVNLRGAQRRALWVALGLNAGFMVVELMGGVLFHSLALLADAAHMLSDVAGLAIALVAQYLMDRPFSARKTYGLQRAEVLGAMANGLTLVAVTVWIFVEAWGRLSDPETVAGSGVLAVGALGLAVNAGSAVVLVRSRGRSLNMHGAWLHMVSDAAGSVAVIVAAMGVLLWDAQWVDAAASIVIGILILAVTWRLLVETVHVLMEGAPRDVDVNAVQEAMEAEPGVESVHHLHLWNLASDSAALSAHLVLERDTSLHDAQERGDRIKAMLSADFGIAHATLEFECHTCEPALADGHH